MNTLRTYDASSRVEEVEYARSGRRPLYAPTEKASVLEVENFPQLFDSGRSSIQRSEYTARMSGNQFRQRRFARPGRSIKDDRTDAVRFQQPAQ